MIALELGRYPARRGILEGEKGRWYRVKARRGRPSTKLPRTKLLKSGGLGRKSDIDVGHWPYYAVNSRSLTRF